MADRHCRLIRSALADSDIAAIRDYIVRNHGKEAAKVYIALLRQAFKDIREDSLQAG